MNECMYLCICMCIYIYIYAYHDSPSSLCIPSRHIHVCIYIYIYIYIYVCIYIYVAIRPYQIEHFKNPSRSPPFHASMGPKSSKNPRKTSAFHQDISSILAYLWISFGFIGYQKKKKTKRMLIYKWTIRSMNG